MTVLPSNQKFFQLLIYDLTVIGTAARYIRLYTEIMLTLDLNTEIHMITHDHMQLYGHVVQLTINNY